MMKFNLQELVEDPIFGVEEAFREDSRKEKISLIMGVYRDDQGNPWPLPSMVEAEKRLDPKRSRDYLPMSGDPSFLEKVRLWLGGLLERSLEDVVMSQTLGGTGALKMGADLFKKQFPDGRVFLPDPTWPNHEALFSGAGLGLEFYPYEERKTFDQASRLKEGDAFLLHLVCHNPTGYDLSLDTWKNLAPLFERSGALPFIDLAYLGFGQGPREDLAPLQFLLDGGIPFFLALSFSKSFGIYGERLGCLLVHSPDKKMHPIIKGHLNRLTRTSYSNPPRHGSEMVQELLADPLLTKQWVEDLTTMRTRLSKNRNDLSEALDWPLLKQGKGMFALLDIKERGIQRLKDKWALFLPKNGRISLSGVYPASFNRIVEALKDAKTSI